MARVEGVQASKAGWMARLVGAIARKKLRGMTGEDRRLGSLAVAAHHPKVLRGIVLMEMAHEAGRDVPGSLKELASIRVATRVGCAYCLDIGSAVARWKGVRPAQLEALGEFETSPEFSPIERAVIRYADAMSETPAAVTDEVVEPLKLAFSPRQLVELTAAIAWEQYRARFNQAVDVPPDGFSDGKACARLLVAARETNLG